MINIKYKHLNSDDLKVFLEEIKKEEEIDAGAIKTILRHSTKSDNKIEITERNIRAVNESPFDYIEGDELTLDLEGFEIKSDKDNFTRLNKELTEYKKWFQQVWVVTHKKEPPEGLDSNVGVLRVSVDGRVIIQKHAYSLTYSDQFFDIGSDYELKTFFIANGFHDKFYEKVKKLQDAIFRMRKAIIFNRFFSIHDGYGTFKYEKFYPLSRETKLYLTSFDAIKEYKHLKKELKDVEEKLQMLNELLDNGYGGAQRRFKNLEGDLVE